MRKIVDLTVVMPVYNHADYISHAIDSILSQEPLPRQVILVDDASSDHSAKIAAEYAANHDFIVFFQNASRMGPNAIFNFFLPKIETDYVFFMSADDVIYPRLFEKAIFLLDLHKSAGVFSALSDSINESGLNKGAYYSPIVSLVPAFFSPEDCRRLYSSDGNWILGCTRIFRTKCLKSLSFYEDLQSFADTYVAMMVALNHGACFSPTYLSGYRILDESYSLKIMRDSLSLKKIMQDAKKRLSMTGCLEKQELIVWERRFMITALLNLLRNQVGFTSSEFQDFIPDYFSSSKKIALLLYPILNFKIHCVNGVLLYLLFKPKDLFNRMYRYFFYTLPIRFKRSNQ